MRSFLGKRRLVGRLVVVFGVKGASVAGLTMDDLTRDDGKTKRRRWRSSVLLQLFPVSLTSPELLIRGGRGSGVLLLMLSLLFTVR